jgi:hypothetical protein
MPTLAVRGLRTRAADALRRWWRRAVWARFGDEVWRSNAWLALAALALLAFMIRVIGASWPGHFTIFFPDSFSFRHVARLTPFDPEFYASERPIAFPMLLFLLGRSTVVAVVVQTMLYGLVYLVAARTVWRLLQTTVARIIGAFLVLTIANEPRFALWNTHILSESFGQTVAVASVVCWWRFAASPTMRRLHFAGLATIAWVTVRDSNVPPWVAIGVPALIVASFLWRSADPRLRRAMRVWGIVTLAVCIGAAGAQSVNGRNRYATMNNVGLRVLPDADLTAWFADHGMPVDAALLARRGASSFDNGWDMLTSPDLQAFRDWADSSGQRVMLLSYIRFAPHWLGKLTDDLPILLSSDQASYDAFKVGERLPDGPPGQLGGPTTVTGLQVWTLLAAAGIALAAARRRRRAQAVVLGLLLASSFIDLYMSYIGDAVEVQRHMVGPLARMALIMALCVAIGLDTLSSMIRERWVGRNQVEASAADIADDASELAGELEPSA